MSETIARSLNPRPVQVGLVQMPMVADVATNVARACAGVREAAAKGAQVICLPEMFNTLYFCDVQDPQRFDLAEPVDGPSVSAVQAVAKELEVVVIVPFFEKRSSGVYHNTAAIVDADGALLGLYRKMHIPQDPGFEEKFYFTPGDLGFRAWKTRYGTIGVCICWDQWYPEAARLTALAGADIIFYPTAIGWQEHEKDALGVAQHTAWEGVQRGHAIANGCFVVGVNRCGNEGNAATGSEFWGQSFVSNPYGQVIERLRSDGPAVSVVECDLQLQDDFRRIWPFFRDRRIDAYDGINRRWGD